MKQIVLLFIALFVFSGCNPVTMVTLPYYAYAVGSDERSTTTIAADQQIKLTIRGKLLDNPQTSLYNLSVESFYGNVYLIGTYEEQSEVSEAIKVAKATTDVKSVQSYIIKKEDREACGMTSGTKMLADIKNRFFKDEHISAPNIHVHIVQCDVVLVGVAANEREKARAEWIGKNTNGIHNFKSFVKLKI